MNIDGIIWLTHIEDKLLYKYHVETYEVEEVLGNKPKFRYVQPGDHDGENVYLALGQTNSGRYLAVIFIYKHTKEALILSARDMAQKERKQHGKK